MWSVLAALATLIFHPSSGLTVPTRKVGKEIDKTCCDICSKLRYHPLSSFCAFSTQVLLFHHRLEPQFPTPSNHPLLTLSSPLTPSILPNSSTSSCSFSMWLTFYALSRYF